MKRFVRFVVFCIVIAAFLASRAVKAQPVGNLVRDGGFEQGLTQWQSSFGKVEATLAGDAHSGDRCAHFNVTGQTVGLDSARQLVIGKDLFRHQRYILSAWIKNGGVTLGDFGLRLYFYDAKGHHVRMYGGISIRPGSPVSDWQKHAITFGADTLLLIPPGARTCRVRFSFWGQKGATGEAWLDDVSLKADPDYIPKRRPVGKTAAVWLDAALGVEPSTRPEGVAELLTTNGFGVSLLTTDDLCSRAKLSPVTFDMLVIPYAHIYPAMGGSALKHYLTNGGSFVSLEGVPFSQAIFKNKGGWERSDEIGSVCRRIDSSVKWDSSHASESDRLAVTAINDRDGQPTFHFRSEDLAAYAYSGTASISLPAEAEMLVFEAKGDEATPFVCLELQGRDGSRWKRVVDLVPQWTEYRLHLASFLSYATEARGKGYDYVKPANVESLWVGFTKGMVGTGSHVIEMRNVRFCRAAVPCDVFVRGEIGCVGKGLEQRFFTKQITNERGMVQFEGLGEARRVTDAALSEGASVATKSPPALLPGLFSGWSLPFVSSPTRGDPGGQSDEGQHLALYAAFSESRNGEERRFSSAAGLSVHDRGAYTNSVWAGFGIDGLDLLSRPKLRDTLVEMVELIAAGVTRGRLTPTFVARDNDVIMELRLPMFNRGTSPAEVKITSSLTSGAHTSTFTTRATLKPYACTELTVLSQPTHTFNWQRFQAQSDIRTDAMMTEGRRTVSAALDTTDALRRIGDFFVDQGKDDGKFSAKWYFVDNRGARGLLGAYEILGDEKYLQAALKWGRTIVSEQREDGGYRMGYGITSKGESCYFADGGEIAVAIARLVSYAKGDEQKLFMDSLRRYMAYRDSFRCEGGGIGVGWCLHDYGQRPIVKLDVPTQIYAPELNTYTIGCSLAAAYAYARLTGAPEDERAAEQDADWLMERARQLNGAFIESYIYAHAFTSNPDRRSRYETFIGERFADRMLTNDSAWWLGGGGRSALNLDGLAYILHGFSPADPNRSAQLKAKMMDATYAMFSPNAQDSICRLTSDYERVHHSRDWIFMCFGYLCLPDIVKPMITMKPFKVIAQ